MRALIAALSSRAAAAGDVPTGHEGWTYLLPGGRHQHLVCLDDDGHVARAVAPWAGRLTIVCSSAGRAEELSAFLPAGEGRVRAVSLGDAGRALAAGGSIDGVVCSLLARGTPDLEGLAALLAVAAPYLSPESFTCVLLRNRLGYDRVTVSRTGALPAARRVWPWSTRRLARKLGFRGARRVHPLLVHEDRVMAVVPPSGYQSYLEDPRRHERLRQLLLGRWGAGIVAPGLALVASRGVARPSFLDELITEADQAIEGRRGASRPGRFLVLGNKMIVATTPTGPGASARRDKIFIVPGTEGAWHARQREIRVLEVLSKVPAVASQVPRALGSGEHRGRPFSVIERIPGVVVDGKVADLAALTERAAEFIGRLHVATAEQTRLDRERYGSLVGRLAELAVQRHPDLHDAIDPLAASVWELLGGSVVPSVCEHGDFKLENVMIDPRSRRLRAVIDWELARLHGLPLIDLLYLLAYNRRFDGDQSFVRVCREVVLPQSWNGQELGLINAYLARVPLRPELIVALGALFPLHALAIRFLYRTEDESVLASLRELLAAATHSVQRLGSRAQLVRPVEDREPIGSRKVS